MVRVNIIERYPDDEEIGLTPLEVENDLIVEIARDQGGEETFVRSIEEEEIREDDVLITLASSLVQNFKELQELGEMGRQLDVRLSMHTPYYIDLASNNELTSRSMNNIRWAGMMTDQMDGDVVVTHMGLYGNRDKETATENILENIRQLMDWWRECELNPVLGLETSGREEVFGTLNEILDICDEVEGTIPILNLSHYHARESGILREPEDYDELFNEVKEWTEGQLYTHFSGVEHESGSEKRFTPIKKGDLRFEPLAEYLVDNMPEMTIICSSPLMEHDAMYMRVIFERLLSKKMGKMIKAREEEKDD